jgi:hypothetical protein
MPNTLADAVKDPDFLKAGVPDQMAYIASIDPDFKAASSEDKLAYLNHVTGKQAPTTANNSVENKTKKDDRSALERGASGAWSGLKAMNPLGGSHEAPSLGDTLDPTAGGLSTLIHMGSNAIDTYKKNRAEGQGILPSVGSAAAGTVGLDAQGIKERAQKGDVAGVVGEGIPAIAATLLHAGKGEIGDAAHSAREGIGEAVHTPEGELTPLTKKLSGAAGAGVGATIGHATPIPGGAMAGAYLGHELGPSLMEKAFPKPAPTALPTIAEPPPPVVSSSPFELSAPETEREAPIQQSLGLKNIGSGEPPTSATAALPKVGPLEGPVQGPRSRSAMQQMGQILDEQMGAGRAKAPGRLPTVATEEPGRQMGAPPLRPDVSLRNQPATAEAPVRSNQARLEEKFPDKSVRQMVHANGEEIVDAAGDDKETLKAIHDLTNPDVRQAMINAGEDMGQTMINNRKASGDMSRQEAFSKLLRKGLTPAKIVELAKQELAAQ